MNPLSCSVRRILTISLRSVVNVQDKYLPASYLPLAKRGSRWSISRRYHRLVRQSYSSSYDTKPILPDVWEFQTQPFGKLIVEVSGNIERLPHGVTVVIQVFSAKAIAPITPLII